MDDWEYYVDDWYYEDIIWCYARATVSSGRGSGRSFKATPSQCRHNDARRGLKRHSGPVGRLGRVL